MKLKFLSIVMGVLTLLAYPIAYVDGKRRQFSKSKESIPAPNLLVTVPGILNRRPPGIYEHVKER